jgi:hypothetical protein
MTNEQIAEAYAALKPGRIAEYVGGGRIRVAHPPMLVSRYVTTNEALSVIGSKWPDGTLDSDHFRANYD